MGRRNDPRRGGRSWTLTFLLLALTAAGSAGPLLAQTPAVVEPGFRIETFADCTAHVHNSVVSVPAPATRACTPAAWGPERLVVGVHDFDGTFDAELLYVDPPAHAVLFRILGDLDDVTLGDIDPAPPGWPLGDLLYVVEQDGLMPNHVTGFFGFPEQGAAVDHFLRHSFDEWMGVIALDPSGAFGHDAVFSFGTQVYRRDPAGNVTLFLPFPVGGMQFGPGGDWGTDLYTSSSIISPDGTSRPSPLPFLGPWAFGPGFEGDMFAGCGGGTVCRIKPDGAATPFVVGLDRTLPTFCAGSLWFFDRFGDFCHKVTFVTVDVSVQVHPALLNMRSRGRALRMDLVLADGLTGEILDPLLMSPAHISRVVIPSAGEIVLPAPSAEPGCDSTTEDGIWETLEDRELLDDGSLRISFRLPSDGDCSTLDGNLRDILALLSGAQNGENVSICFRADHPDAGGPFEGCGEAHVLSRGRHPGVRPLELRRASPRRVQVLEPGFE